jgi:hypothetical protein
MLSWRTHSHRNYSRWIYCHLFTIYWLLFYWIFINYFIQMLWSNNIFLNRVKYLLNFVNITLIYFKIFKCFFEILPSCIKLLPINLIRAMSSFHILSSIMIWPSCYHFYKLYLTTSLFLHICVSKIKWNSFILKNKIIKFVYN